MRNENELKKNLRPIIKELNFFKERADHITNVDLLDICSNLKYEYYAPGKKIVS